MVANVNVYEALDGKIELSEQSVENLEFIADVYRAMYWHTSRMSADRESNAYWSKKLSQAYDALNKKTELICSVCGKSAAWNRPYRDGDGNIYCNRCADNDRSGKMLYGIDQRTDRRGRPSGNPMELAFSKNGCLVTLRTAAIVKHVGGKQVGAIFYPKWSVSAWTNGGSHAYFLKEEDKTLARTDPEQLVEQMLVMVEAGRFRCSSCGAEDDATKIAGYPLFAGIVCKECWKKHLDGLEEERRKGHVCRMCGQPYGNCCC